VAEMIVVNNPLLRVLRIEGNPIGIRVEGLRILAENAGGPRWEWRPGNLLLVRSTGLLPALAGCDSAAQSCEEFVS
jgi:hypothetical protein